VALFPEKSEKSGRKSLCGKRLSAIFLTFDLHPSIGEIRFFRDKKLDIIEEYWVSRKFGAERERPC
jgi:hypothetical protein